MISQHRNTHVRLHTAPIIWLASVRPTGRPHLVPVWFVWYSETWYLCIDPHSVKARNIAHNAHVTVALEDGTHPIISEGVVIVVPHPWPVAVVTLFQQKYDWRIDVDEEYTQLLAITPHKWLGW